MAATLLIVAVTTVVLGVNQFVIFYRMAGIDGRLDAHRDWILAHRANVAAHGSHPSILSFTEPSKN